MPTRSAATPFAVPERQNRASPPFDPKSTSGSRRFVGPLPERRVYRVVVSDNPLHGNLNCMTDTRGLTGPQVSKMCRKTNFETLSMQNIRPSKVNNCQRYQQVVLMARPEGFEPPTPKFVVWCSIQLSYGRILAARGQKAPSGKVAGAAKPLSLVARAIKRKALVPVLGSGIIRSSTKLNGSPKGAARVNAGNGPAARCGNGRPSCRRQASVCRRAPARVRRR